LGARRRFYIRSFLAEPSHSHAGFGLGHAGALRGLASAVHTSFSATSPSWYVGPVVVAGQDGSLSPGLVVPPEELDEPPEDELVFPGP
jgi:hypothetical protein